MLEEAAHTSEVGEVALVRLADPLSPAPGPERDFFIEYKGCRGSLNTGDAEDRRAVGGACIREPGRHDDARSCIGGAHSGAEREFSIDNRMVRIRISSR